MRELEFLPKWYLQLWHRRRLLMLQVWVTIGIAAILVSWLLSTQRRKAAQAAELDVISRQVAQSDVEVRQMDRMELARKQCRQKADVLAKLGTHVDGGRLLGQLQQVIPATVALTQVVFEIEETPIVLTGAARASIKDSATPPMDRRLRCRLAGVAPTDDELGDFLRELTRVAFVENISMPFARDKRDSGHILREFELTFIINLNVPTGS